MSETPEQKQFKKWGTKCPLPWIHLHIWPNHDAFPCCITTDKIGSTKDKSLKEVWNSPGMKQIRKDMIEDKEPDACKTCYMIEKNGQFSLRKDKIMEFKHHFNKIELTQPDGYLDEMDLRYWDFRFSNVCNLKCRSCGPQLSTGWYPDAKATNLIKLKDDGIIATTGVLPADVPQKSDARLLKLWEELEPHFNTVESIYFAGGEPLLMEEHYRILNRLIDDGRASEVKLAYNTNFTTMSFKNQNILDLWPQFRDVSVGASLDAYGRRAEFLRAGCDWKEIENNRILMKDKTPNTNFFVASTVGIANIYHITDLHKYLIENEMIDDIEKFRINVIHRPDWLCITNLPKPMKAEVTKLLEEHMVWLNNNYYESEVVINEIKGVINFLNSSEPDLNILKNYLYEMKVLDIVRKESWKEVCPEIYKGFLENEVI